MFAGIKSVIYPSANLEADKKFWSTVLGVEPYFDQPYYVGYKVQGTELGLDPNTAKEGLDHPVAYWHVTDITEATAQLSAAGATVHQAAKDVGGGTMLATFKDTSGNVFGLIMESASQEAGATPAPAGSPAASAPAAAPPDSETIEFGSWAKIVIVEDNESIAEIYKKRMEMIGYICSVAHEGNEALQLIEKERPSLVLLDLMVPGVAGDQILKTMRANDWGKDIKVLIISNLNEADAPAGLRMQGIEGYAVKANLTDDQLDQMVNKILHRSESAKPQAG